VAAQRGPAAPALVGCTGDGNCSEAPFGEHIGGQTKPGVGSRAIAGIEAQDSAADQPEMATGLNLKGPPVRFPAAKTRRNRVSVALGRESHVHPAFR
jgi:hypothetical protein